MRCAVASVCWFVCASDAASTCSARFVFFRPRVSCSLARALYVLLPAQFGRVVIPPVGFVRHNKSLHLTAKSGIQFVSSPQVWLRRFLRQVSLSLWRSERRL